MGRAWDSAAFDAAYVKHLCQEGFPFGTPDYYARYRSRYKLLLERFAQLAPPEPVDVLDMGGGQLHCSATGCGTTARLSPTSLANVSWIISARRGSVPSLGICVPASSRVSLVSISSSSRRSSSTFRFPAMSSWIDYARH